MWYRESREAIQEIYGSDWRLMTALLAATSAHSALAANVTLARRAYNEIKATGNVAREHYCRSHYSQIQHVLKTGQPTGQKVLAFYRALIGDTGAPVIDIWMQRYFTGTTKSLSPRQYKQLASNLISEAAAAGKTVTTYQAEVWERQRRDKRSYAYYFRQYRLL